MTSKLRHYVVLAPSDDLVKIYRDGMSAVLQYVWRYVYGEEKPPKDGSGITVADLPSGTVRLDPDKLKSVGAGAPASARGLSKVKSLDSRGLVAALEFDSVKELQDLWTAIARDKTQSTVIATGADIQIDATEFWSPREASDAIFGHRAEAERLLGVEYLRDKKKLSGKNVNVLVVDRGVDFGSIPLKNRGTGWYVGSTAPGVTKGGHGMMIVRNILSVAPDAIIHDLPLLPERIGNIKTFLSVADAAFDAARADIQVFKQKGQKFSGPWIMVNAWALFDRQTEHPPGDYTNRLQHPFNKRIARAVADDIDVVFCAGNCGQFCPDNRCGAGDWGPDRSILGANSHPDVLTIGAVRSDTRWLGYSSQGRGQPNLEQKKPDLCAPSQFRENDDAHTTNGGTSAATGLAAGVVAGLRSKWDAAALPPAKLKKLLIKTARKTEGPQWNNRLGHGILDAQAAYDEAANPTP